MQTKMDPGSPIYRLIAFVVMLVFLTVLSYLSASNFDETELRTIGGMAVVTFLALYAPDLAHRLPVFGKILQPPKDE